MSDNPKVRLCLNMIVRDEEHIIERCLDNIATLFDIAAISDTGSTDRTVDIIRAHLDKLQKYGKVSNDRWEDFGTNRTRALRFGEEVIAEYVSQHPEMKDDIWYFMFMDADNLVVPNERNAGLPLCILDWGKRETLKDAYLVEMRNGTIVYDYAWFIRVNTGNRFQWVWKEPIHEYIFPEPTCPVSVGKIFGVYIKSGREGSRNRDPQKYLKDALIFEQHIKKNPTSAHTLYYCGQSYRDAGLYDMAEKRFIDMTKLQKKDDFTYLSLSEIGRLRIFQGRCDMETLSFLLEARELRPNRFEAPYSMIVFFRMRGYLQSAVDIYNQMKDSPVPEGTFVDYSFSTWKFHMQGGIALKELNRNPEAKTAFLRALQYPNIDEENRKTLERNLVNLE